MKPTLFAYILQDISKIISVCTHSKHFISGKEADLSVACLVLVIKLEYILANGLMLMLKCLLRNPHY